MTKTKKANKKSHRTPVYRRPAFVICIILLLVVVAGVVIFLVNNDNQESASPAPETPAVTEDESTDNSDVVIVGGTSDTGPFGAGDGTADKTEQYEGEDPNALASLTGSVSYATVRDGVLSIGAMIDQFISGGGICILTLQGDKGGVYKASADTVAGPSNSYCDTFRVPTSELPTDYYQIKIEVNGGDKTGIIEGGVQL